MDRRELDRRKLHRREFEALITKINKVRHSNFEFDSIKDGTYYTMHDARDKFKATYTRTRDNLWELVYHTKTPEKAMTGTHGLKALKLELDLRGNQRELGREQEREQERDRTAPRPPPPRLGWWDKLRNLWPWGRARPRPRLSATSSPESARAPAPKSPTYEEVLHPKAPRSTLLF